MIKHVKLFEQFLFEKEEDALLEEIFQDWKSLFEAKAEGPQDETHPDYDPELKRVLTSGEKAAKDRGMQILSDAQLAGMYLRALGITEDDKNKYLSYIAGDEGVDIMDFADNSTGSNNWANDALADALGIGSTRTLIRTVAKLRNMIDGTGGTETEVVYPKVIKAFEKFKGMKPTEIGIMAGDALQKSDYSKNRDAATAAAATASGKREADKAFQEAMGRDAFSLARSLKPHFHEKAMDKAVQKISQEKGVPYQKVKFALDKYLKDHDVKL